MKTFYRNHNKKLIALLMVICTCATMLVGCSKTSKEKGPYIYYLTAANDGIGQEKCNLKSDTMNGQIEEMIEGLSADPQSVELKRTIPSSVKMMDYEIDDSTLVLYFNREYSDVGGYKEVLIRAAIVKTLLQIDGIDGISFYVAGSPLVDVNGSLVGIMTADTFIEDFSEDTKELAKATMALYFASADGQALVKRNVDVYYNTNVSMERLIVEHLLQGPENNNVSGNIIGTMPSDTKLKSISVNDGVCYVRFDSGFLNGNTAVSSKVMLYSIVDSLTELDSINKVQISVETGSTTLDSQVQALGFELNTSYERDVSLVLESPASVEEGK
ncbi:MAG: GerMN domain-containing protein [Lachnospiraceae bacterium]|nr:GerMN domain-containing protein [Lachnospiraceae bacterium]